MKVKIKFITHISLVFLFLSNGAYAKDTDNFMPKDCTRMNVMNIKSKIVLKSSRVKCIKYIVHNGGSLHYDVFADGTSVIIIKPGGKLTSEEDVHAIVNRGGETYILDGTVKFLHAGAGITKTTIEAEIENQSGSASVELDNNLKVSK